jgi:hypothetical protein
VASESGRKRYFLVHFLAIFTTSGHDLTAICASSESHEFRSGICLGKLKICLKSKAGVSVTIIDRKFRAWLSSIGIIFAAKALKIDNTIQYLLKPGFYNFFATKYDGFNTNVSPVD